MNPRQEKKKSNHHQTQNRSAMRMNPWQEKKKSNHHQTQNKSAMKIVDEDEPTARKKNQTTTKPRTDRRWRWTHGGVELRLGPAALSFGSDRWQWDREVRVWWSEWEGWEREESTDRVKRKRIKKIKKVLF